MLPEQVTKHVEAALRELQEQKATLERQRANIDIEIKGAEAAIEKLKSVTAADSVNGHVPALPFVGLSVRLAILKLFGTHKPGPLSRTSIANRLQVGGIKTKGDLRSNVSAVLSQMTAAGEMDNSPEGWNITSNGLAVWKENS